MAEKKVVTQEEFNKKSDDVALVALKLIEKMDTNKGEMGIVLRDKDFREGQIITNEDGDPVIDINTGEVKKYPDAYYIEFSNSKAHSSDSDWNVDVLINNTTVFQTDAVTVDSASDEFSTYGTQARNIDKFVAGDVMQVKMNVASGTTTDIDTMIGYVELVFDS
jgi:hypothetical protein